MSTGSVSGAKRVNRADLLRALHDNQEALLPMAAELCGFTAPKSPKIQLKVPTVSIDSVVTREETTPEQTQPKADSKNAQTHYYRVVSRQKSEILPELVEGEKPEPSCLQGVGKLNPDKIVPLRITPPEKEPLVAWAKLWPVLRNLLSESAQTRQPDIPKIVHAVANGHWLERIPRKRRQRWTANVQVLVDRPERTCLFNQDYNHLLEQLRLLRGETGLSMLRLLRQPGGRVRTESTKQPETRDWSTPSADTTVFILSDLGLLDESGASQRAWLRVGKKLRLAGCRPVVLLPLPARYLTPELVALFDCITWDRSSKLQVTNYAVPKQKTEISPIDQDAAKAKDLLTWLSPAVRVEPALLRAVRHQLAVQNADIGQEVAAWHHEDVVPSSLGFHFQPQKKIIEKYRQRFTALINQSDENRYLAIKVAALILNYHRHAFPSQRDEELLLLAELLGDDVPAANEEVMQARQRMQELVKAGWAQAETSPGIRPYLMHLIARQDEKTIRNNDFYQAVWGYKKYELEQSDDGQLPEGFDPKHVLAFVEHSLDETREYVLFQEGLQALQLSTRKRFEQGDKDGWSTGTQLVEFETTSALLLKQQQRADGAFIDQLIKLDDEHTISMALEEKEFQKVHVPGEEITIERFVKPKWATTIGYDKKGQLYADTQSRKGEVFRWYWWYADTADGLTRKGYWFFEPDNTISPTYWADATGNDEYGLYAESKIAGIPQRFRWIEPTTFQMGSPETEEGHESNETQHQVTLSQGYWLADTTCTQQLWQAVMGDNPSSFKGETNPVEQVSWDNIQKFLQKINKQQPELDLRLPTEAEWENACRAGSETPFHFGVKDDLNLEKVNYSGKWDDSDFNGKTKSVKTYSPNQWGLHEMHGNVLEWCEDWYGKYPDESVVDPQGPEAGGSRVQRGGSWFNGGRYCRSAFRRRNDPSARDDHYGFRFARGHGQPSVGSVRAGQQQIGQNATREHGQSGDDRRPPSMAPSSNQSDDKTSKSLLETIMDKLKR